MQPDEAVLIERFTRLGIDDPEAAARSEVTENIPQLAYARLEHLVRTNLMRRRDSMEVWWTNLQRERDRRPGSPTCLATPMTMNSATQVTFRLGHSVRSVPTTMAPGSLAGPWTDFTNSSGPGSSTRERDRPLCHRRYVGERTAFSRQRCGALAVAGVARSPGARCPRIRLLAAVRPSRAKRPWAPLDVSGGAGRPVPVHGARSLARVPRALVRTSARN